MKRLKIQGPFYDVNLVLCHSSTIKKKYYKREKDKMFGMFDPEKNRIYLATDQSGEQMILSLMHEMSHVIDYQMQYLKDEESKAEVLGSFLIRLCKITNIKTLLNK